MTHSWSYQNPVDVRFGGDAIATLAECIGTARYALVTYDEPFFAGLTEQLTRAVHAPEITVNDVLPNPDCRNLKAQTDRVWGSQGALDLIVAIGGGSVIDTAKVLAAGREGFDALMTQVRAGGVSGDLSPPPLIAVPTTAGTGSEVTCWATVWDEAEGVKYSLAHADLYPRTAVVDPALMLGKSVELTRATGLDALSHALESIWNKNANPVSARHAVFAARTILQDLPELLLAPDDLSLRSSMAEAALSAGLAFSNTKTAIAHNISYPVTLHHGVAHGIACSFTLPTILRSLPPLGGFRDAALAELFGEERTKGADQLAAALRHMGLGLSFKDYGVDRSKAEAIIEDAFLGQRGKNFIGNREALLTAAQGDGLI
jgi:alcohol dehydrogenase